MVTNTQGVLKRYLVIASIVINTLNIQKDGNLTLPTSTKKITGCVHVRVVMTRQWTTIRNYGRIIIGIAWKVGRIKYPF